MVTFELLDADKYYKSLLDEIPKAKKRIVLASIVLLWGERTAPVFIMLQDALKRGVKVTILLDRYTRLTYLYGLTGKSAAERLRQTYQTLSDLSGAGAKVYSFGKIGFPPQKGRCHVKISIVDNMSYSFGGINLFDECLQYSDYMLMSRNVAVADCLEQLVERISHKQPPLLDGEVGLDKNTHILFDGGHPKHSLIYERACELTAHARHVHIISQMVPSGQLARLLHETNATIYTNRPEQMRPLDGIAQAFDQQKYRMENSYSGMSYIHAKTILFEMPSSKKIVLSGSHNFSLRGVDFGTQEIALESHDPKVWDQVYAFAKKQVMNPGKV